MMQEIPCRDTDPDPYAAMNVQVSTRQGKGQTVNFVTIVTLVTNLSIYSCENHKANHIYQ